MLNINKLQKYKQIKTPLIIFIFCLYALIGKSQDWSFELMSGLATNAPARLRIKQTGFPVIAITANYKSESLVTPVYWVWRFGCWKKKGGWEFEAVHHKIFLKNLPQDVQRFSISHGLNLLCINRSFKLSHWFIIRLGAGPVLAHAENTIRGLALQEHGKGIFGMGYYMSGVCFNFVTAKRFMFNNRFYANLEARFNPSYSVVPVVNGYAHVPNLAFQVAFGLGYVFIKK